MEMKSTEEYLIWIRKLVGPTTYIEVPMTKRYQEIMDKLKDPYIVFVKKKILF